jgi:hypothetical protein
MPIGPIGSSFANDGGVAAFAVVSTFSTVATTAIDIDKVKNGVELHLNEVLTNAVGQIVIPTLNK